jgi:TRAP-type C4-dicarboxylate transport system permease small subunit
MSDNRKQKTTDSSTPKVQTFFNHITNALVILSGVFIVFATVSVCLNVLFRYFLNRPMQWVIEFSEYSLLFMTYLGTAWVLREGGHVRMDMFVNRLGLRGQALVNSITYFVGGLMCGSLTYYSAYNAWSKFETGIRFESMLRFPMGPIFAVVPIGFFLLFIQFLLMSHRDWNHWRELGRKSR